MNTRTILAVVLVAGLVTSAVGATAATQANSPPSATAAQSGGSAGATDSASGTATGASSAANPGNYTRLYVTDQYRHLELKPGQSETVTVTVENGEDESVELSPHVVVPPRGQPPLESDWISIEPSDVTLEAGESREFEVTVAVPDDAEVRDYSGVIALTNETVQYPGRPAQPVHRVSLNVDVWEEPTITVEADRHIYTQVQAGDSFTREVTIENTGDQAVPLNPQVNTEDRTRPGPARSNSLDRSWISIDAPSEVGAGETVTAEITVSPPENADRGDYSTEIDLGLRDPTRSDRSDYWQQIRLHFQVWNEPESPFETSFEVSEDATDITLELSGDRTPRDESGAQAAFDVTFVAPDGTEIEPERVRVTNRGNVDLGEQRRPGANDGTYATTGDDRTVRYEVTDPDAGSWSVEIMPENTMGFSYEIVRNESN